MSRFICAWALALFILVSSQAPAAAPETLMVLGDSISAGYGIKVEEGWVPLLQARLDSKGYGYRVVNASVSGETTSGGLARLPRALAVHEPDIVVVELGGNDGLRGVSLDVSRKSLGRIIEQSKAAGAEVVLVGMRIPPNYGPRYTQEFADMYVDLARRHDVPLVGFFLEKVALGAGLMQDDGLHPTAKAQPILLDTVWPAIEPLLKKRAASR